MENPAPAQTPEAQKIQRTPKGTFPPGVSGNPEGKPRGYQSPRHRMQWLAETMTIEQIMFTVMHKKTWRKLNGVDGLIFKKLHAGLTEKGLSGQRAADYCLDQLMGKAAVTVRHGGAPEHGPIQTQEVPHTPEQALSAYQQAQERAVRMREEPEDKIQDAEFSEVNGDAALAPPGEKK